MAVECYCDINAYALKGMCECEEDCSCNCAICECEKEIIDLWHTDMGETTPCPCGGNCSCGEPSYENT